MRLVGIINVLTRNVGKVMGNIFIRSEGSVNQHIKNKHNDIRPRITPAPQQQPKMPPLPPFEDAIVPQIS